MWHTSLLLAVHLTASHVVVSIVGSIALVDRVLPDRRGTPWVGRRGLIVASVVLLVVPPALALTGPRRRDVDPPVINGRRNVRGAGMIAFGCTAAQFVLTYAVPSTGLAWPVGLALTVVPIGVGVVLLRRCRDGFRIVRGVLTFVALLCVGIGLGGRYDTTLLGVVALVVLVRLRRRRPAGARTAG